MSTVNLELLWVIHEGAFYCQCICLKVLELPKLGGHIKAPPVTVPEPDPQTEADNTTTMSIIQNSITNSFSSTKRGVLFNAIKPEASEFVLVGVWMDCPACRTRYRVTEIDYDTSEMTSGKLVMELGAQSGAMTPTGAKLRMLMDDK